VWLVHGDAWTGMDVRNAWGLCGARVLVEILLDGQSFDSWSGSSRIMFFRLLFLGTPATIVPSWSGGSAACCCAACPGWSSRRSAWLGIRTLGSIFPRPARFSRSKSNYDMTRSQVDRRKTLLFRGVVDLFAWILGLAWYSILSCSGLLDGMPPRRTGASDGTHEALFPEVS